MIEDIILLKLNRIKYVQVNDKDSPLGYIEGSGGLLDVGLLPRRPYYAKLANQSITIIVADNECDKYIDINKMVGSNDDRIRMDIKASQSLIYAIRLTGFAYISLKVMVPNGNVSRPIERLWASAKLLNVSPINLR